VASQAVTGGTSVKQSTHKHSHLGSGAQKRLVEALKPTLAPHERERHVNLASTDADSHMEAASEVSNFVGCAGAILHVDNGVYGED
jgi:hypothetical protein